LKCDCKYLVKFTDNIFPLYSTISPVPWWKQSNQCNYAFTFALNSKCLGGKPAIYMCGLCLAVRVPIPTWSSGKTNNKHGH